MDKNRKWRCDCSRLRALSAGLAIWQSCCALAVLALAGPALAGAEGPLVTAKRGEYTCETPGTALTSSGLHQPEEDFAIRQGSIYTNPAGRGSYLASGDEIRMTSGPKSGQRFRRTSENFLRKLTLEGQESDIRCVRKVLNNR